MKAMRLHRPTAAAEAPLLEEEVPRPEPGADDVLIRVEACGVCHTDLHLVCGELPPRKLPIIPGHQVVGVVAGRGPRVTQLQVGARVGVPWLHRACGVCAACRRGQENLCPDAVFTGYHVDGGYAEYLTAPAEFVSVLPASFTTHEAAPLLCAGIIGYRSLRLAEVRPGSHVGLFGFGASAHLALQVARHWGCTVSVFTRSAAHRALALDLGASWVGGSQDAAPRELDSAVVFAPSGGVVVDALAHLRRGGTLAINAVHLDGIPAFDYALLYWERTIRSVSNSTRQDARQFLALAAEIPLQVRTEVWPLDEANAALATLRRGTVTGAAVLEVSAGSSGSGS